MKAILKPLASPAMIVACAALIVALGGVSYAAAVLPKGSVGTAQLKKKAVTASKLRANSVSGLKVKNGTLTAGDFKAGQLPKGDPGAQGPKGNPGISQVTVRASNYSSIPANSLKGCRRDVSGGRGRARRRSRQPDRRVDGKQFPTRRV